MQRLLFLLAFVFSFAIYSNAQDIKVPKKMPSTKEECISSKKDFIGVAKWLENTAVDSTSEKRQMMNAWAMAWMTNSPLVTVEINSTLMDVFEGNAHLLLVYLAGYSRYCVENNTDDKTKAATAGIRSTINCYKLGGQVVEKAAFTNVMQLDKDGKLEEWAAKAVTSK